jgi:hypothetical protein
MTRIVVTLTANEYTLHTQGDAPHFLVLVKDASDIGHVIEHFYGTGPVAQMHELNCIERCALCAQKWAR